MSSTEDLFEKLFDRVEGLFRKVEKTISDLAQAPIGRTVDNDGFFEQVTYSSPEKEPLNDPIEYKVVRPPVSFSDNETLEAWLNTYGADGWDLHCFEYGQAIFSRFVEDTE